MLSVQNLGVHFAGPGGEVQVLHELSFELEAGGSLGIVGESGSGKSQMALALLGLLAANGRASGAACFEGEDLLRLPPQALRRVRGARIALVFQDPMSSLNPYLRIGTQMAEVLVTHVGHTQAQALAESRRMLEAVQLSDAPQRLHSYPHQLSGGQRQRVMVAMSLLCKPRLLICDEPTTALDVTVQAQLLDLLEDLRREFGMALMLISHDLAVVSRLCARTLVLYAGRERESGPTEALLRAPRHPYTAALLASRPPLHGPLPARLPSIEGQPPQPGERLAGCDFHPRCARAAAECRIERPSLSGQGGARWACHRPG